MLEFIEKKIVLNNQVVIGKKMNLEFNATDKIIYEVIRLINRKALFVEDHINRFFNSINSLHIHTELNYQNILDQIELLVKNNTIENGNIKFQLMVRNNNVPDFMVYFIQHNYPNEFEYINGVNATIFKAYREKPNAKIQQSNLRDTMNQIIKSENVYEVVMVHPDGYITEGSRSNLFMIKNMEVYTAPMKDILPGITRKYIIEIIKEGKIKLNEKRMSIEDLLLMDSIFITGTSPKVLPIKEIKGIIYDTQNPLLKHIIKKFDRCIENYLERALKFN